MTEAQHRNENMDEAQQPDAGASPAIIPDATAEIASLKDQLLRALAEAENTRRRALKEREDTSKYAVTNFAKEMLNVADNFARALEATPKDSMDPAVKNLVTGIEATERQLQAILERFGIKKLEPLGQAFDPNFHRAMMEIEAPDQAPGTILQVLQAGYVIHDRLLREALVGVAKGGTASGKVDQTA
jgi:molecular chaperone GrpE